MPFVYSRLKIERANKHITELDNAVREFLKPHPYGVRLEKDPESGNSLLQYGWTETVPAEQFALIIGDAVHNLRTALDLAWVDTIQKIFGSAKHAKFPVCETVAKLESDLSKGRKIRDTCFALYDLMVSEIKPYEGGNDAIWALHRLDILDKHRLLIPLLNVGAVTLDVEDDRGNVWEDCTFVVTGASVGAHGPYTAISVPGNLRINRYGDPSVDILFDSGLLAEGKHVIPTLRQFSEVVAGVVGHLELITA